ncbi:hypothetical protein J132_10442 [Termitomyces sp. J132]|nr:hypothetical protein J132_10442 [Termitomyces sp. J132]
MSEIKLWALKDYLDNMLGKSFIYLLISATGAPVLFAKKKDGSLRLCVDYMKKESSTKSETHLQTPSSSTTPTQNDWHAELPLAELTYNNTPHSATGVSPFSLKDIPFHVTHEVAENLQFFHQFFQNEINTANQAYSKYTNGKIRCNAEGKIILPSGAMIPNYFGKRLYIERIKEWHRLNPGQIVTGRLSSNTNPDPEQAAMQQSLIHEVMQQDVTTDQALSKEERIEALERELFALQQNGEKFDGVQVPRGTYRPASDASKATPSTSDPPATSTPSDSTPVPAAKPADKGKAPESSYSSIFWHP